MKNRLVLEYLSIMFNEKTIRKYEEDLYKNLLESEVSIKDFYVTLRKEGMDRQDILSIGYDIFEIMKNDKDREESLKIVSNTIKNYKRYFGFENYKQFINKACETVSNKLYDSPKLLKKIKVLPKVNMLEINKKFYKIDYYKNHDNFNCIELYTLVGAEQISDIVAILFKDGKGEMLKATNRKEYEAALKRLELEESKGYDFLFLA